MAKILEINPVNPQPRLIAQVVEVLQRGGVIGYPTDTMYGIGCDIFNQKAVKRVYQIKRRPKDKPFSFMCASLTNISAYGHVGNTAYRLMRKNLPGPYTFVLSGTKVVPKIMLTRQKTVGIRVPDNIICQAIIEALGNPVLNTSAAVAITCRGGCSPAARNISSKRWRSTLPSGGTIQRAWASWRRSAAPGASSGWPGRAIAQTSSSARAW